MKYLSLCLMACLLFSTKLFGQCQDITIDTTCINFSTICSSHDFSNRCGSGWSRSNGTPELILDSTVPPLKIYKYWFALMIADNTGSEGMFKPYSFIAGQTYNISIYYSTSGSPGTISLYAANGLVSSTDMHNCQASIPSITAK